MNRAFFSLGLLLLPFCVEAKPKICLNMIVKDESKVITRCLDSVKPMIDYWVIVDTGSKDGTQEIIKNHLKGIPGELFERPWKNFGESRTEAIELAIGKGDYILFMDADDILEFEEGFKLPALTQDVYNFWRGTKDFSYLKPQLVKGDLPWRWVGVTHEYLDCPKPHTTAILEKVKYTSCDGGARSVGIKKFLENIKLLEDGLVKEPKNERYAFYLAESYRDAGQKGKAIECYQKRIAMGGWVEEVFWSKLQIALNLRYMGLSSSIVTSAFKEAHDYRPHRLEPVYYLAESYNQQENYTKAYEYLKAQAFVPKPSQKDSLFNEDWIDQYGLLFQLSICSYYVGNYQESLDSCDKLLAIKHLPEAWRKLTETNRTFALAKLKSKIESETVK